MTPARLALLPLLVGCTDTTLSGTAVGNLDATLSFNTPTAPDIAGFEGSMSARTLSMTPCEAGAAPTVFAEGVVIGLDGSSALALPTGTWCGAQIELDAPATWLATSTAGFSLDVTLDLGALTTTTAAGFEVSSGLHLVWTFGDRPWLDAARLGADVADVVITPGSDDHDELVDEVEREGSLFHDEDDDRERDDDDRDPSEREDEDEREDPPDDDPSDDGRDDRAVGG